MSKKYTPMSGDRVKIYEYPLTKQNYEGMATIEKVIGSVGLYDGQKIWRCAVKFDNQTDGTLAVRKILMSWRGK
jgi:hypothetical protein